MPIIGSTGSASTQSIGGFANPGLTLELLVVGGGGAGGFSITEFPPVSFGFSSAFGGGGGGGVFYKRTLKPQIGGAIYSLKAGQGGGQGTGYSATSGVYNGRPSYFGGASFAGADGGGFGGFEIGTSNSGTPLTYNASKSGYDDEPASEGGSGGGGSSVDEFATTNYRGFGADATGEGLGNSGADGLLFSDSDYPSSSHDFSMAGGGGGATQSAVTGTSAINRGYAGGEGFTCSITGTSLVYGSGGGGGIAMAADLRDTNWWTENMRKGGTSAAIGAFVYPASGIPFNAEVVTWSVSSASNPVHGQGGGGGGGFLVWDGVSTSDKVNNRGRDGASGCVILKVKSGTYSSVVNQTTINTQNGYDIISWVNTLNNNTTGLLGSITF